jgi:hypothetical protein
MVTESLLKASFVGEIRIRIASTWLGEFRGKNFYGRMNGLQFIGGMVSLQFFGDVLW